MQVRTESSEISAKLKNHFKDNGKVYSEEDIALIKAILKDHPDNLRYEKKRTDKKNHRKKSEAKTTIQDILGKERIDLYPILKLDGKYFAIIEDLGVAGDFGKVKYAQDLDDKDKIYVLKTQETFKFIYPIAKNIAADTSDHFIDRQLEIQNQQESLTSKIDELKPGVDDKEISALKAELAELDKQFKALLLKKSESIKKAIAKDETIIKKQQEVKFRATTEMAALKALERGTGSVIERQVDRGMSVPDTQYNIIMDYIPGATLQSAIDQESLSTLLAAKVISSAIEDWNALKSVGFYHGDLKPDNIKFNPATGKAKLIDFGSVVYTDPQKAIAGIVSQGAPAYKDYNRHLDGSVTEASEVYSFGCLLAESMQFGETNNMGRLTWVPDAEITEEKKPFVDLAKAMTNQDRTKRPTMDAALQKLNELRVALEAKETQEKAKGVMLQQSLPNSSERQNNQTQLRKVVDQVNKQFEIIEDKGLSGAKKRILESWKKELISIQYNINQNNDITLNNLIAKMSTFFDTQCKKYDKPNSSLLSKFNFRKEKEKNASNAITKLNKEDGKHNLTRGVGLLLKQLAESPVKGSISKEVREKLNNLEDFKVTSKSKLTNQSSIKNR